MLKKIYKKRFNFLMTLYINFRHFPFKVACKLPIYMFGKWSFDCSKKSQIIIDGPVTQGMICLGINLAGYVVTNKASLKMKENSKIIFRGNAYISQGCQLYLNDNAILDMHKGANLGDSVKVICYQQITIGRNSDVTWESQITDFGSHFIQKIDNHMISTIYNPVEIGDFCWVGNRSTIMPGTKLPNRTIVASNSLLNKNYKSMGIESYSLLGGIPAKLITQGLKRIYLKENEQRLKDYFLKNKEKEVFSFPLINE